MSEQHELKKRMTSSKDFAERELKYASLDLQNVNREGVFEGYASLFHTIDLGRDIVNKGAFQNSLINKPPLSVKMLYQHNPSDPIGIWETIKEDHKGLYVKGRLILEIQRAREVHTLMKAGAIDGLSIGFKTLRSKSLPKMRGRELIELELFEISVVTFPMHPNARVHHIKRQTVANGLPSIRDFERWLMRDAGFTRREAQTAIAKGFRSLTRIRDDAGNNKSTSAAMANNGRKLRERLNALAQSLTASMTTNSRTPK